MAKKLVVSQECKGCGACLGSPFINETPEGFASVSGNGVLSEEEWKNSDYLVSLCPIGAISFENTNEPDKSVKQHLSKMLDTLKAYQVAKPDEKQFPMNKNEYSIPIPCASGEYKYDYSSSSSAENAAKEEFNIRMYSQIDYLILDVISQYRAKYLLPYYSKDIEAKSVYLKYNEEISQLLADITRLLKVANQDSDIPKDFYKVNVFPENDIYWKMLNKGELMADNMIAVVKQEFLSGSYSSLSSYGMYWNTDDMDAYVGSGRGGKIKTKTKYCYKNLGEAFQALAKDLLDAFYYVDDSFSENSAEIAGGLIDAYNESLKSFLKDKIAYVEKKLNMM